MTRALYRGVAALAEPALDLFLRRRLARGKEDPLRWRERKGLTDRPRPAGKLLWIHGASMGEARSALPLLAALRTPYPDLSVLFTTGSRTSAEMLARELDAPRAFHQFVPLDVPRWAGRFLDHWRPDAALWLESELWPNLLGALAARGVPAALINARLTERSAKRWAAARLVFAPPLDAFALAFAQSEADAERLRRLGFPHALALGNLKHDAPPLAADESALAALRASIGRRPVWLAASTHPREEPEILAAHAIVRATHPDALLILAPRHAERGEDIAKACEAARLPASRRVLGETPGRAVYVADTMGEMGLFYRAAMLVFVGGSLEPHGGQNPLEPARLGAALAFGPSMENFAELARDLEAAGAAARVADAQTLARWVRAGFDDPAQAARAGAAGQAFAKAGEGTIGRVLKALDPVLAGLGPKAVTHAPA
ncbi:MAG: 3-deoxy-D-manno-octulosonic acid transferase [Tagaea sp.]|nr:3-deoxy-D-manno-octulosonic acid transferase [Tagaea sp.]